MGYKIIGGFNYRVFRLAVNKFIKRWTPDILFIFGFSVYALMTGLG